MAKRLVAMPLWFVSIWLMYGLVAYFLDMPDRGGAVLGALVAAFVWLDPTGAFWGRNSMTDLRPAQVSPDSAAEIAR